MPTVRWPLFALGVGLSAAIWAGCASSGGAPDPAVGPTEEATVRVLSFNIRYDEPADGVHAWPRRADRVAGLIRDLAPHAAGLQEALLGQVEDLATALPGYEWIGVGRDDGDEGGELSPIFYRRDRLEPVESGTFWLSPEPGRPGSVGWDADLPRIATWAVLRDRQTGGRFLLVNTHFDHRGVRARAESARLLRQRAARLGRGIPVVLTGDLNAEPEDPPLRTLTAAGDMRMCDARRLADRSSGPGGTFSGFEAGQAPTRRIDYVLVSPGVDVVRHEHVVAIEEGAYPSDHLPVLADLRIPAGKTASSADGPCASAS